MTPLCVCMHHRSAHERKGPHGKKVAHQCHGWTTGKRCECMKFQELLP